MQNATCQKNILFPVSFPYNSIDMLHANNGDEL